MSAGVRTFSDYIYDGMVGWEVFGVLFDILLVYNIPTMILMAICFFSREKMRQKKDLEKMSVQDLQ